MPKRWSSVFLLTMKKKSYWLSIVKRGGGGGIGIIHSSKPFWKTTEDVTDVAPSGCDLVSQRSSWFGKKWSWAILSIQVIDHWLVIRLPLVIVASIHACTRSAKDWSWHLDTITSSLPEIPFILSKIIDNLFICLFEIAGYESRIFKDWLIIPINIVNKYCQINKYFF